MKTKKKDSGKEKKKKSEQLITLCGIFWSAVGKTKRSFFSYRGTETRRQDRSANKTRATKPPGHCTSIGGPMDDNTPLHEAGGAGAVFPFLPHVRWLRPARNDPLVHRSPSSLLSTLPHSDHTPATNVSLRDITGAGFRCGISK